MRKLIITGMAVAMLAVPAVASASVNVNDQGVGTVGKGDVQNALAVDGVPLNDAAMQDMFKAGGVKFTASYSKTTDNTLNCVKYVVGTGVVNTGDTFHRIFTTSVTQTANAAANVNGAGKLTNGWTLNGFVGPATEGPTTSVTVGTCPAGTFEGTTANQVYTESSHGLKVNGIDLPNTPVQVAPVA